MILGQLAEPAWSVDSRFAGRALASARPDRARLGAECDENNGKGKPETQRAGVAHRRADGGMTKTQVRNRKFKNPDEGRVRAQDNIG